MGWYQLTATVSQHGKDPDNAERLLDAFAETHPEVSPATSQNLETGKLSATIAVEGDSIEDAVGNGVPIVIEVLDRSGLRPTDILEIEVSAMPVEERVAERELLSA